MGARNAGPKPKHEQRNSEIFPNSLLPASSNGQPGISGSTSLARLMSDCCQPI